MTLEEMEKMKTTDDIVLKNGKTIFANNGIIGIAENLVIYDGCDGLASRDLTNDEEIELCDLAIERWQKRKKFLEDKK